MKLCRDNGAYLFSDEMYRLLEADPATRLPSGVDSYGKAITLSGATPRPQSSARLLTQELPHTSYQPLVNGELKCKSVVHIFRKRTQWFMVHLSFKSQCTVRIRTASVLASRRSV